MLRKGGIYRPNDVILGRLKYGMDVSVVGRKRTQSAIVNVYRSQGYLMNPYTAMQYTGLQDYRSRTGETGMALVLAERSPSQDLEVLSHVMEIPEEKVRKLL
jgi:threonine synthase